MRGYVEEDVDVERAFEGRTASGGRNRSTVSSVAAASASRVIFKKANFTDHATWRVAPANNIYAHLHTAVSDTRARGQPPPPASTSTCELGCPRRYAPRRHHTERATISAPRAARTVPRCSALVPLIFSCVSSAHAQTAATLDAALDHKEDAVLEFKLALEAARIGISARTLSNATCDVYSACSAELATFCHFNYGNSAGCGCETGRTVDSTANSVVVVAPAGRASPYSVKRTACEAKHVDATLRNLYGSMIEVGDAKWLFYGSEDGALINFPGIVGRRRRRRYVRRAAARIRPWHMPARPARRTSCSSWTPPGACRCTTGSRC